MFYNTNYLHEISFQVEFPMQNRLLQEVKRTSANKRKFTVLKKF